MSGYSFKAFDPATGTATAFLPDYSTASCSLEFSDVGSLKIDYPASGRNFSAINADRVEVGVFFNGVEIDDGRFTIDSDEFDEVDFTGIASFNGRSLLNLLDYCIVYPLSGTSIATSQTFATQTAGAILRALFLQNSTRGGQLASITWASFSNTTDSNGVTWASTIGSIEYKVGTSYLDIVRNLVDNGMIEVKMVGRDLRVYNAGTMGTDRTVTNPPIVLRKGKELLEAPTTSTSEQVAGVALIEGDDSIMIETSNSTVNTAWGRRETYISQGGISDTTTLGVLAAQELTRRSAVRRQKTRKLNVKASGLEPNVDYRVSDYIFSDTTGVNEKLRVRQLVIELDNNNVKSASIVLNDKFLEQEIAIARKVAGILGGATATGSIATPSGPDDTDTTIPSQVTGLSWSSAAYQAGNGETYAQITATWTNTTTNTNSTVMDDFDFYEVQVKRTSSSDWPNLGSTRSDTNTAYMSVPPNASVDVRVRAVDQNGNKGAWSSTSAGTTAADASAPPTPSTPTVTPYLGQLRIFWDGLGSVGQAMPTDFRYTEVHMSTSTGFTPSTSTLVDQLSAKGYAIQTDLTYGTAYYFKLIAVDRSGNASAASAQGTASPETVTGLDIAALTIATSNMADLAISTAKIADAAIINAKIANLAVDDAKIGNMSVGKLTAGSLVADITVSARIKTANTGARVELNSSGLQAYNSSGVLTVDVAAASGAATFTGIFKTDFSSSTTPHIEMLNSGDRTTIWFTDSSGSGTSSPGSAFMNTPLDGSNKCRVGINSGTFTMLGDTAARQRLFMNTVGGITLETNGTLGRLGYTLFMGPNDFTLQKTNASNVIVGGSYAADDTYAWMQSYSAGSEIAALRLGNDGTWFTKGRLYANNQSVGNFSTDFIVAGTTATVDGNATTHPISYGATAPARPGVIYSLFASASPGTNRLSAFSTTGFTVETSNSQTLACQYWAWRTA